MLYIGSESERVGVRERVLEDEEKKRGVMIESQN